jgi:predicted ATPase
MNRFVIISGCSGGGKSALLTELGRRGHAVVQEPGRRIVTEELQADGSALPWQNVVAFARRCFEMALSDRASAATHSGLVFFDRALIDAASAIQHLTGEPALAALAESHRYNRRVFLAPPWPEIYRTDHERRHGLEAAIAEYERLLETYPALGYEVLILPKVGVAERADFVLQNVADTR